VIGSNILQYNINTVRFIGLLLDSEEAKVGTVAIDIFKKKVNFFVFGTGIRPIKRTLNTEGGL